MGIGANRVRASFNPSGNNTVDQIKAMTADLIDMCESLKARNDDEVNRLASLAQDVYEQAAMWAVKAATA